MDKEIRLNKIFTYYVIVSLFLVNYFKMWKKKNILTICESYKSRGQAKFAPKTAVCPPLFQITWSIIKPRNTLAHGSGLCTMLWNYTKFNVHRNIKNKVFIHIVHLQFYLLSRCFDALMLSRKWIMCLNSTFNIYFSLEWILNLTIEWWLVIAFRN